ncbi:restriction endonuclease subunit S [Limnohabitans sp.]|uniref:restriction endonuclease subunit S n=1 Tax=Limnohabitans sp. TaxID=1907725 RepID=UPI00311D4999
MIETTTVWPSFPLGDVCRTTSGGTPSRKRADYFQGDIPWVKSGELTDGLVSEVSEFITEEAVANSSAKLFPLGTLLIAMYGATVGKLGILAKPAATNQAVCAIFPPPELDSKFLFWFLRFKRSYLIDQAVGGAQPNISQSILRELMVPVPPIDVQRETVAEIEKQFSRLDEAVANLQRVKANLKRYKASVLKAAVEGRLVETEGGWLQLKLGEIALSVRNGYSHKPDAESGTRIFRISAVRPMELAADDVRFLSGKPADYDNFLAAAGDVLFTRYNGSRDYVGVCAVVPKGLPPTVYPDKLIRVRVPQDKLLPAFLVIAASTGEGRGFIESVIRTTAGQSGVSGTDIKAIPVSLPSMSEQVRIVAEVDRHLSVIREVEADVDANIQRAQALRQATLAKVVMSRPTA